MPQSPQALEPQAKPHLPADRYDWAIQMANAALKINPNDNRALEIRAEALRMHPRPFGMPVPKN
jgi:Flp pilus assembly protein TadD